MLKKLSVITTIFRGKDLFSPFYFFTVITYLTLVWMYRLDSLPGLHGDEAWSGIRAFSFINGENKDFQGMTYYTGLLQALVASISFTMTNVGVLQLRFPGVLLNLIGLTLIYRTAYTYFNSAFANIFLLFICQSSLLITSPRIAWEVNTFTLFLLGFSFWLGCKFWKNHNNPNTFLIASCLLPNIFGSYNHYIFSTVSASAFLGMLIWRFASNNYKNLIVDFMIAVNFLNSIMLIVIMKFVFASNIYASKLIIIVIFSVVIFESVIIKKMQPILDCINIKTKIPSQLILATLLTAFFMFVAFHGRSFFEVFSSYKVLLQIYSYEVNPVIKIFLVLNAIVCIFYCFKFLINDLKDRRSLIGVLIITYTGIFTIFTVGNSFRYYLIICIIIALYIAYKTSLNLYRNFPLLLCIVFSFGIGIFLQIEILFKFPPHLKAINFTIGNGQKETSEHFLPKEPLLNFLRKNKVGMIYYIPKNSYFLQKPLEFYRLTDDFPQDGNVKAIVGYNYDSNNTGFSLSLYE